MLPASVPTAMWIQLPIRTSLLAMHCLIVGPLQWSVCLYLSHSALTDCYEAQRRRACNTSQTTQSQALRQQEHYLTHAPEVNGSAECHFIHFSTGVQLHTWERDCRLIPPSCHQHSCS